MEMKSLSSGKNRNIWKRCVQGVAQKVRECAQSSYDRKEFEDLGDHILEDIGMDEETQKRRKESTRFENS